MDIKRTMLIPGIECKNPIIFGGCQRSFGVIGGQTLKTFCTQYFKKGSGDESHTWYVGCPYRVQEPLSFWWNSKGY